MAEAESLRTSVRKRRIPKACVSCRRCKVKCDGKRPCTRCTITRSECVYFAVVRDPTTVRLEELEHNVRALEQSLHSVQQHSSGDNIPPIDQNSATHIFTGASRSVDPGLDVYHSPRTEQNVQAIAQPTAVSNGDRMMSEISSQRGPITFRIRHEHVIDIVSRNLVTLQDAYDYFNEFFKGCDRFVPVFDPETDTFNSIRSRSSILFDVICTVGCKMTDDPPLQTYQLLNKELKTRISDVVINADEASLEAVQALLVVACYSEKGWLLTSIATRMALVLDLPRSYDEAVRASASQKSLSGTSAYYASNHEKEATHLCFRRARTWLGLVVLEHIFSLDSGKLPGIEIHESIRRCRSLVAHPARTLLDLRLLSQVELNSIRANAFRKVSMSRPNTICDAELTGFIQDIKIDLDMWIEDWLQIITPHATRAEEREVLVVNLRIQRDWAEIMVCCKALQSTGIENIAMMSPEQHQIIHMVKQSSQRHLNKLLSSPMHYLATFRYTMDFVWAKCAFSVLLLLKLAVLLPEGLDLPKLLADAKNLVAELSNLNTPRNIYFQILSLSAQKAEQALKVHMAESGSFLEQVSQRQENQASAYSAQPDAEADFQTYVPKEFVFEWDFPNLTLFFIPNDLQDLFSEFLDI